MRSNNSLAQRSYPSRANSVSVFAKVTRSTQETYSLSSQVMSTLLPWLIVSQHTRLKMFLIITCLIISLPRNTQTHSVLQMTIHKAMVLPSLRRWFSSRSVLRWHAITSSESTESGSDLSASDLKLYAKGGHTTTHQDDWSGNNSISTDSR